MAEREPFGTSSFAPPVPERKPLLLAGRRQAEKRFPFLEQFRDVNILLAPSGQNKKGLGEFLAPDEPSNPTPGQPTITIGEESANLQGGIADTIIADMIHAASDRNPTFQTLKRELRSKLSPQEIAFAKRRYDQDFKDQLSGSNFATFENFLDRFWLDGIVQHLLLPERSEIDQIMANNPNAIPTLAKIRRLFEGRQ